MLSHNSLNMKKVLRIKKIKFMFIYLEQRKLKKSKSTLLVTKFSKEIL